MRHATVVAVAAGLLAAVGAAPAQAWHECNEGVVSVGGVAYVVLVGVTSSSYLFSFFVYAESNGEPGLQRGGSDILGWPDWCQQSEDPDRLLFDPTVGWP